MSIVTYSTCSICSDKLDYDRACDQAHQGVCHWCAAANLPQEGYEAREHYRAPPPPRVLPALTPREQAAVAAYVRHVQAVCGTGPLVDLVTEED